MSLEGRKILITRAREDCEQWAARLRESGALPVVLPCLVVRSVDEPGLATSLTSSLNGASWIVATSRRGVERARAFIGGAPPEPVQRAAVGPRTASRMRQLWGRVDLVAEAGTGRGLAEELAARLSPGDGADIGRDGESGTTAVAAESGQVVVVTARSGRHDIESHLGERGIRVERFELYETVPAARASSPRRLSPADVDVVLLASPSAVRGLLNRATVPDSAQIITMGPTTTDAARRAGLRVDAEARTRTLAGLLEAIR